MLHQSTALALFESTDSVEVLRDPVNADWLTVVRAVDGSSFFDLERRYYLALRHFRGQRIRPLLPGQMEIEAATRKKALEKLLEIRDARKEQEKVPESNADVATFVDPHPADESWPEPLRDFSQPPPSLRALLSGPGRPPCDALCMMRAFLGAQILVESDSPTDVHRLLHSNPTFARACGFRGRDAPREPGELTSRQLPGESTLREFNEVMTRYGLWHQARLRQVEQNLSDGTVEVEDTLVFDTTHIEAYSHCANVVPPDVEVEEGKKPKHRKVPRVTKTCSCGRDHWEDCEHPWMATDHGAGIVWKGFSRIYWAHKASFVGFGQSEIPVDARVTQYAAEHDGKTLIPHLQIVDRQLPDAVVSLRHVVADDAYQGNHDEVTQFGLGARLTVPVHRSGRSKAHVAERFRGIDRFTGIGVPICQADHRFEMLGRDIAGERYIWAAPDGEDGAGVCDGCPFADECLGNGSRRHIRVDRDDFPQIDWEHPQHLRRNKERYKQRTGVERAIKRIKVDLAAEDVTVRDGLRVQAHLDRRLLVLHLLLAASGG